MTEIKNIANSTWTEKGQTMGFPAKTARYAIVRDGKAVSFKGEMPSAWGRKATAQMILDTTDLSDMAWIELS